MTPDARRRIAIGVIGALLAAPATGQAQEPERDAPAAAERTLEGLDRAGRSAERSRARLDGPDITYGAVLADPDNIALNLAYARTQAAAGDLKGARSTLERVLLIAPEEAQVRAFLGLVHYRLGEYALAERELARALEAPLPDGVRRQSEAYLAKSRHALKRTKVQLDLSTGIEFDHNRNQAPLSGTRLSLGTPLSAEDEESDWAALAIAGIRIQHDLGLQGRHSLEGRVRYFESDKFDVDRLDLRAIGAEAGGTYHWGFVSLSPKVVGSAYQLMDDPYLTTLGGALDVEARVSPALSVFTSVRGVAEDFRSVEASTRADLRDGGRWSAALGAEWAYKPIFRLRGTLLGVTKDAEAGFETFDRLGAELGHTWLLGDGHYLFSRLGAENSGYAGGDPLVSSEKRKDWVYRAGLAYGAPLKWYFGEGLLPEALGLINLSGEVEYERAESNISNYEYDAARVQLLLSRRLDF